MADVEVIDFDESETNLLAEILQSAFQMVDTAGTSDEVRDMFNDLLDAMEFGATVKFKSDGSYEGDDGSGQMGIGFKHDLHDVSFLAAPSLLGETLH